MFRLCRAPSLSNCLLIGFCKGKRCPHSYSDPFHWHHYSIIQRGPWAAAHSIETHWPEPQPVQLRNLPSGRRRCKPAPTHPISEQSIPRWQPSCLPYSCKACRGLVCKSKFLLLSLCAHQRPVEPSFAVDALPAPLKTGGRTNM